MADIVSKEQRKLNMQHIKGKDTSPEIYLRKLLFADGFRYGLHTKTIPGHPDIWMAKYNTAIFVHGCFWHRHKNCKYAYMPKSRIEFWSDKFKKNVVRDNNVICALLEKKIKVLIVWECTIKTMKKEKNTEYDVMSKIKAFLVSEEPMLEL